MSTFYISTNIYGGHVALLAESTLTYGAELIAVNGLAMEEIPSQDFVGE